MRAQEFITEGQEKKLVTIYTNPANKGATVDDSIKKSLPVQQISFDKLQQWESHKTMQDPRVADWVNNKLLPELQQNGTLDPLSVWNNNGELFVIDGNHRFVAYQQAGYRGRVPVQIVPDNMITIVDTVMSEQAMAENKAAGINKACFGSDLSGAEAAFSQESHRCQDACFDQEFLRADSKSRLEAALQIAEREPA